VYVALVTVVLTVNPTALQLPTNPENQFEEQITEAPL